MKKSIYITILVLTIVSCSTNGLDGTWIVAYSENDMELPDFKEIYTFKNGQYEYQGFTHDFEILNGKGSYDLSKSQLDFDNEVFLQIKIKNNESLVTQDSDKKIHTLKRLNDSLKTEKPINLMGRTFIMEYYKNRDTVYFKNDSILISKPTTEKIEIKWTKIRHNGYEVIFKEMGIPMILKRAQKDSLVMYGIHKKVHEIKMTEL